MFLRGLKSTGALPTRPGKIICKVTGLFRDANSLETVSDGFVSILPDGSVTCIKVLFGFSEPIDTTYQCVVTTLYTDGSCDSAIYDAESNTQIYEIKDYDQQFIATNAAIDVNSRFLETVIHLIDGRKI